MGLVDVMKDPDIMLKILRNFLDFHPYHFPCISQCYIGAVMYINATFTVKCQIVYCFICTDVFPSAKGNDNKSQTKPLSPVQ